MTDMFIMTPALSNFNKGNIHEVFSTNQNWTYDWRDFVAIDDSNFQYRGQSVASMDRGRCRPPPMVTSAIGIPPR